MKTNILALTRAYVNDNRHLISGNVATHLFNEVISDDGFFYSYLSDGEIEQVDSDRMSGSVVRQLYEEVKEFITVNFDMDIDNFIYPLK